MRLTDQQYFHLNYMESIFTLQLTNLLKIFLQLEEKIGNTYAQNLYHLSALRPKENKENHYLQFNGIKEENMC